MRVARPVLRQICVSDWAERGKLHAITAGDNVVSNSFEADSVGSYTHGEVDTHWSLVANKIESEFYGFRVAELTLTVAVDGAAVDMSQWLVENRVILRAELETAVDRCAGAVQYLTMKVAANDALSHLSQLADSLCVERRRLFCSRVVKNIEMEVLDHVILRTMEDARDLERDRWEVELRDVCRLAFRQTGYTRHFLDPVLSSRRSGLEYLDAMMERNLSNSAPRDIVVAIESDTKKIIGFSVRGRKGFSSAAVYTQLLSAVEPDFRGRGLYRSMSRSIESGLPADALLLSVTHRENLTMQRAAVALGRRHLADSDVIRLLPR